MILDTLVGSKCYKKSFKLSDSNRIYLLLLSLSFVLGGLPRWLSGKESISQCSRHRKYGFYPCVGKIPWRKKGNLLLYSCLGNTMDRSLVGYSPWSQKTWTWLSEHANCDSRKRQSQEDLKTVQFLRKNVFLIEMCLNAAPCLSPEAVPCRASVWMKRRPASSPLWAVWGQVNQEMWKGFRGRFTIISSGSISEHHRQGTSSLNEFLFTAILLRSIQMVVNMYFYFLKILSDSSYWE